MRQKTLSFLSLILLFTSGCKDEQSQVSYPISTATYAELNEKIGCDSKFVEQKKTDIFNASYLNHWMIWTGEVMSASPEDASLNLNGKGLQDLHITFANKTGGYDLLQDETITVKFLMNVAGGCILPFEGTQAQIVPDSATK